MVETEVTTMSEKGQVVIPYPIRTKMGLKPKTKLLVYGSEDTLILKKLYVPDLREQWEKVKEIMNERNKKYGELTEEEIAAEVKAYRREQATKRKR
jgi:AbrB family looped-hinge helix DNA binding protein